jgi:positive phototaxis protein PixI
MSDSLSIFNPHSLTVQDLAQVSFPDKEQFLRLYLVPGTAALLPIQQVTEVLTLAPGQIVPIPHMPAWVMGVYNWRGEILWMVDLGHLCGLTPWYQQSISASVHKAVAMNIREDHGRSSRTKGQMLGLVVDRVEDIEWCNVDEIQSLPLSTVNPEFARFLHGFWWKSNDDMLAVLNGEAILRAMPK